MEQIAIDHRLVIAESASKVVFSLRLHFDVEGFSLPFYTSVEPHAATLNAGINYMFDVLKLESFYLNTEDPFKQALAYIFLHDHQIEHLRMIEPNPSRRFRSLFHN